MDMYERIDAILKERKMSRRQLAIKAEIPESSLGNAFMRKTKNISYKYLENIAAVLDVDINWLIRGDQPPVGGTIRIDPGKPVEEMTDEELLQGFRKLRAAVDEMGKALGVDKED